MIAATAMIAKTIITRKFDSYPAKKDLEDRIRSKLSKGGDDESKELTPWEKYKEKRKQKRKERRQAARGGGGAASSKKDNDDKLWSENDDDDEDDFFMNSDNDDDDDGDDDGNNSKRGSKAINQKLDKKREIEEQKKKQQRQKEELELLMADGEEEEEQERDYDIRGIQRMDKNKNKKLTGSRKRKELKRMADVTGTNFKVDVADDRFAAVLDGIDSRFGIDKTDPKYKETPGMREILSEQTKRRRIIKKRERIDSVDDESNSNDAENNDANKARHQKQAKKRKNNGEAGDVVPPDVNVDHVSKSGSARALSAIVQKLKSRFADK